MNRVHTLIATVLFLCFTITAGFGFISLFHSGHHSDTSLSCPFANHVERTCSDTLLGHFEAWSHTFLLVFAFVLLFVPLRRLYIEHVQVRMFQPRYRERISQLIPTPLEYALAHGIVHSKVF